MMLEDGGLDLLHALASNVNHQQDLSCSQGSLEGIELVTVLLTTEQCRHACSKASPCGRSGEQRAAA